MSKESVTAEWHASWSCPKCGKYTNSFVHDISNHLTDSSITIVCKNLVDGGESLLWPAMPKCGHEYEVILR